MKAQAHLLYAGDIVLFEVLGFTVKIAQELQASEWLVTGLLLPVLIALIYFFGKLNTEQSPWKEQRSANYIAGAAYLAIFVLLPATLLYGLFFEQQTWQSVGGPILLIIAQSSILSLMRVFSGVYIMGKRAAETKVLERMKTKTDEAFKKLPSKLAESQELAAKAQRKLTSFRAGPKTLFILNLLAILSAIALLVIPGLLLLKTFSLLILLATLSQGAILYGLKNAKRMNVVVMYAGKSLSGALVKLDSDYIVIEQGEKTVFIPSSKIEQLTADNPIFND